jgi:hypothetical protein
MPIYTATFAAVAISAAQDVFDITAAAGAAIERVRIREIKLNQYTDFGDAQAEILSVTLIRGFTTVGSGGSAVTPTNLESWSRAAVTTVLANNTTVAQDGTGSVLIADAWNVAAGWSLRDVLSGGARGIDPADPVIKLASGERLVVRITAPADSITCNGTLVFEEV